MRKPRFAAHGNMQLSVEKQMLVIKASGSANVEFIKQYHIDVAKLRLQMTDSPWTCLVVLSDTPMLTPDAKTLLTTSTKQAKSDGLCATAVVIVDQEEGAMIRQFWHQLYSDSEVNYQFFEQEDQARIWLQQQLTQTNQ